MEAILKHVDNDTIIIQNLKEFMRIKRELKFEKMLAKIHKGIPLYIFVYKYILYLYANQISPRLFNKKNNEIYDQHYDHSYNDKNIIIDYVNDDCLAEIFTYVPTCERPKIALVCKKWKRALDDSWFNVKKFEITYWRYDEYPNCLEKYPTIDGKLSFLKSLLNKCGRYLTKLDLTAYDHCNIVPVVNDYCPNLVKLRLRFTSIDDALLCNAFTRLSKLKSLTVVFQNMKYKTIPVTLINSLRNIADTLTELYLLHFVENLEFMCQYPKEFNCVIRELKALKRFEDFGVWCFEDLSEYLKDNKMLDYFNYTTYARKPPYHAMLIIEIDVLDLKSWRINDDSLYTIANTLWGLRVLSICCEWVTDDGVVALSKMNYLEYVYFLGRNNVTDSSIKLLKNIKELYLPRSKKITDVSLTKLLVNSPNMKRLYVKETSMTAEFVKKAAEISNNRKKILTLFILITPDLKQYESPYFKIDTIDKKYIFYQLTDNLLFNTYICLENN